MSALTNYQAARQAFARYCAMGAGELPEHPISRMQVELFRWRRRNLPTSSYLDDTIGIAEEMGELAASFMALMAATGRISHAVLKNKQRIRGFGDEEVFRAKAADAIADAFLFMTNLCTTLRLDVATLLAGVVGEVMERDWISYPNTGRPE
jgi:hypothetical protein